MYTIIDYMEYPKIFNSHPKSIFIMGYTIITFMLNNEYTDTHPNLPEAQRNDSDTDDSPSRNPPSP